MTVTAFSHSRARPSYLFLHARDFPSLVGFYGDTVGLPLAHFEEDAYAFFALGGGGFHLAIYPGRETPIEPSPHWFLVVDVDDLDRTVAALRARGAPVGDAFDVPHGRAALVVDPEHNTLQLHERTR